MDSTVLDTSPEAVKTRLSKLSKESRDISKVWNDAVQRYNETANVHNKETFTLTTTPYFPDAQAMRSFGDNEMQKFSSFRTKGEKITRLRKLFMKNIDFIDTGSKQLLSAASASFPPAIVISTAMTFVLTGCKSLHADYDAIANFFEDMNNFFERVSIIGTRVPEKRAYQNALVDVFISMLSLCAVARRFIAEGRFKTWIKNSIFGGDADLQSYRAQMDNYLEWLQSATEFAILDNTENMLEQQVEMSITLAKLRSELDRNGELRDQIAASQHAATEKISNDVQTMMKDVKKLLALQQEAKSVKSQNVKKPGGVSGNVVRHFYGLVLESNTKPFPDMLAVVANLEKSQIEGTGSWLFEDPAWLGWVDISKDTPSVLLLKGGPGMGKTHLSLSAYQQLCDLRSSEHDICVAYFSCYNPDEQRRHIRDLLRNCAIQVVDQSATIRRKLEEKWRKFELHAGVRIGDSFDTDDNRTFIFDNFRKESKNQLFVVIDNIDEFDEVNNLRDMIREVEKEKLRIKFMITSIAVEINPSQFIRISKEQILPDMRKILWRQVNSEDSAYDGLRKLSRHCKRKLAQTIERNADNLLYVDQVLRFLADVAREGSDIEKSLDVLPVNLTALYEAILEKRLDGLSLEQTQSLKSVFMWLTVSWHPLTIEWLNSLANTASSSIGPQVSLCVLQFFGVDTLSGDTMSLLDIDLAELFEDSMDISTERSSPRDGLRLQAKNRSIKAFFTDAGPKHEFRSSLSDAHRIVFLTTVDIILHRKTETPQSLYAYSIEHSLMHWQSIVPEQHTDEEKAEVCKAFFQLISDDRYVEGLVRHPYCWCLETIFFQHWQDKWYYWSRCAEALPLPTETIEYWRDGLSMLHPLAVALVRHWVQTLDVNMAIEAWIWANGVWKKKSIGRGGFGNYKKQDILEVAGILGTDLDSRAHFAIASVLALPEISDIPSVIEELHKAFENCRDIVFRTQCRVQLAAIYIGQENWKEAVENCNLGLDSEQASTQKNDIVGQKESAGNRESQSSLQIELLRMRAVAMRGLDMDMEAAESFCEARQLSTEVVPAEYLFNELLCLQESPVALIDRLLGFKPIDRLHFLTSDPYKLGDSIYFPPTRIILPAVVKSQRVEEVIKVYREVIDALDSEQAGAPVRVDLARILWRLGRDKKDVRFLLNQVLDGVSEERRYKLTDREPMGVAHSALLLMTDILLEEFRSSKKVEAKVQILLQAKNLPRRKFLVSQPLITDAVWDPYSIAVAEMLRKIGPMSEYEQVMKMIFDKAVAGLNDGTKLNDSVYLMSLSRILMMIPSLGKFGEMLYAVHRGFAETKVDKYASYCDGICLPVTKFNHLDTLEPHYKCLICTDNRLCQSCYETRIRWNADSTSKTPTDLNFCCPNGHYMRIPMEGLRGVEAGVLRFAVSEDGAEIRSIQFTQLIEDIKVAWEKAWEDLASGIGGGTQAPTQVLFS